MIGMPQTHDIRVERLERAFGVLGGHGHGLGDLLVDDDVDLDALLGLAFEEAVEAVLGEARGRATQV